MKTLRLVPALIALCVALPAGASFSVVSTITAAGTGGGADAVNAMARDASGNLYVAGYLTQAGGSDIWIAKYNPSLVLLSSYTYDYAGFSDMAWGVDVDTPSDTVFATGYTASSNSNSGHDIWVAKFNSSLVLQATSTVNGSGNDWDEGRALRVSGGSIYVVGLSSVTGGKAQWVARYDTSLVLLSSSSFVQYDAYGIDVLPVSGNVFVAGSRAPNAATSVDAWIGKYNSSLVLLASATVLGSAGNNDQYHRLADDGSGGVFAAGYLNTATAADRYIIHYDANLVLVSSSLVNGPGNSNEYLTDIVWTPDSTLLVAGDLSDTAGAGGINAFIAEYTPGLALLSSATYRSAGAGADHAAAILIGASQYIYASGWVTEATQDAWIGKFSTATPAAAPAAPSAFTGTAQSSTSIRWSWTDNSADETGFRVKFGGSNASGDLAVDATTWLQTGLSANATSGSLLAQAFNSTGTADSGALELYSLADPPNSISATFYGSSVAFTWPTMTNPAGTRWSVERGTDGVSYSQLYFSSAAAAFTDTGLAGATTYYYRVRSANGDGVYSSHANSSAIVYTGNGTLPAAPSVFAGTAQTTTSILWNWTDNSSTELGFRLMAGTTNISGDLAANTTTWLQTGLGVNTSSGSLLVQAFNSTGTSNSGSLTRYSLAAVPSGLATSSVFQTSATVTWTAGNPAGTTFELERSIGAAFTLAASTPAAAYTNTALTAATTYYYRVRALNSDLTATAYTSTITVITVPAPPVPGAAGTPVGTALGVSSVSWTWVLASGATDHSLFRPSDNSFLGSSVAGPFVQTALTPNTAYGLRAAGVNASGTGPLSPSATVYTLAADLTWGAASSATATTQGVLWSAAGNPAGTVSRLERSTNAVVYSTLTVAAVTAYFDDGLIGCTTYYYRVRSYNGGGLPTAYFSFQGVTGNTNPGPPAGLTASANAGGTVGLAWGPSPTEGVTGYRVYWDAGTGTVAYGAPLSTLGPTAASYTTGVLTSSAAYTFAVRAVHRCGVVESTGALAMSGAAAAAATVRAAIKEPDSGKRINGNRITILGELIAGTPSDVQQIAFQYKLATSTDWADVAEADLNNPNPDFSFPYFTHVDVTGLPAGSYDLRAVAYDRNGVPDSAPPAVRVVVDHITPDIVETAVNGTITKTQDISNVATSVVETCGSGASDPSVRVTIPAGAVTTTSATVSVIANPVITTAAPSGQTMVGSSIKIDLSNGQTALNGTAQISLTYPNTVLFPSLLQIYYLNEATGQWSRDFNSTVDTASRTVTGNTPHFSTFALMLGTSFAADLNSVQVYPVPYKPNGANADEGGGNTGIVFAKLALGSEIKIYTLTGRLVASLDNAPVTGSLRWDARNQDGRDVASGAYFAVIKASGSKSIVKKLVIIR